jgi:membrane-associated phospholipid phosphatase
MSFKKIVPNFQPIDIATSLFILVTGLYIILNYNKIEDSGWRIVGRAGVLVFIFTLVAAYENYRTPLLKFFRNFYPLAFLGFFYTETDALNNVIFPYLDPFFSQLEYKLFGGQPSILFYKAFPYKGFIELMNFAYFCYYPLIFFLCFWLYLKKPEASNYCIYTICAIFYLYYIIFIIIPSAGPQYYFSPPDNKVPKAYLFSEIVHIIDVVGERPTAAFPSSHVGIICIVWYLCVKHAKNLLKIYIPIGILLFLSTVYIKAHYLIDVLGGIISAPILYWISSFIYSKIKRYQS